MKNIVLAFDGTWNTPDDEDTDRDQDDSTNVWKFYEAVSPSTPQGIEQIKWYEKGVGTNWYTKITGGVFGAGLSNRIQDGYQWLAENFAEGDQIYLVGFSRGAYTARSLVGMIRNAGLLLPDESDRTKDAYDLYRDDEGPDSPEALTFRESYSREIRVRFLGVWDTVGSLGIPVESYDCFNKAYYQFNDTKLGRVVENAFHAVAIDEHRKNYTCTLWDPVEEPSQRLEQVWFAGAHANVGGGYADNQLSDIPLLWMLDRAVQCGLAVDPDQVPDVPADLLAPLVDSYSRFLKGAYRKLEPPFLRQIGGTRFGREEIHPSVTNRSQLDAEYRPGNPIGEHLRGEAWNSPATGQDAAPG